jgi:predicted amidophosphoribosyltransferase
VNDDDRVPPVQQALATTAGGFLRNPVTRGTCARCFTPLAAGGLCSACRNHQAAGGGPDLLGLMTYAGYLHPISQSGHTMRGYKNPSFPQRAHWTTVVLLSALGLFGHLRCAGTIVGVPVSAWATVPSLPPKPGNPPHALNEIARRLARPGATEVVLLGSPDVTNPRGVNPGHFAVVRGDPEGRHVLLIEDTWTGGGHLMSATLALRAAGCTHVSALALARWLSIGWGETTEGWARRELALPDYQTDVCPWTQGPCPTWRV